MVFVVDVVVLNGVDEHGHQLFGFDSYPA